MSFEDVATLLLPAAGGAVVGAGDGWNVTPLPQPCVWGHEPTWMPAGPALVGYALRRERALAGLHVNWSDVTVHRWSHSLLEDAPRPRATGWLRAGALVEMGSRAPRVIDLAAQAAGFGGRPRSLHFGAGGQIGARSTRAVLRVARAGSPVDPEPGARALERLVPLALVTVPRPLGRGVTGVAAWSAESLLPGRRARQLTPALVHTVAGFCLSLPRQAEPPTAFASDIACLVEWLPQYERELRALEDRMSPAIATLPSVLRHGDLWLGNLLVERGVLSGVVDWDAWHPAGVPGTDLLHLVASSRAFATRRSFGELMAERPWEHPLFTRAAERYWRELGVRPTEEVEEAVGAAWWAMHTRANLQRHPHMARDRWWLERGVESLLRGPRDDGPARHVGGLRTRCRPTSPS